MSIHSTIYWEPKWQVGHPQIDGQHQAILSWLNLIGEADFNPVQRHKKIPVCIQSMQAHMRFEAQLLNQLPEANWNTHQTFHAVFLDSIRRYAAAKQRLSDLEKIEADLIHFFRDWWLYHIIHEDQPLKRYFAKTQR